jgi:hypothetical protein
MPSPRLRTIKEIYDTYMKGPFCNDEIVETGVAMFDGTTSYYSFVTMLERELATLNEGSKMMICKEIYRRILPRYQYSGVSIFVEWAIKNNRMIRIEEYKLKYLKLYSLLPFIEKLAKCGFSPIIYAALQDPNRVGTVEEDSQLPTVERMYSAVFPDRNLRHLFIEGDQDGNDGDDGDDGANDDGNGEPEVMENDEAELEARGHQPRINPYTRRGVAVQPTPLVDEDDDLLISRVYERVEGDRGNGSRYHISVKNLLEYIDDKVQRNSRLPVPRFLTLFNPKGTTLRDITDLPSYVTKSKYIQEINTITGFGYTKYFLGEFVKTKDCFDLVEPIFQDLVWSDLVRIIYILHYSDYTAQELISYIWRASEHQCLEKQEVIAILSQYVYICHRLSLPINKHSPSLKRELDVAIGSFKILALEKLTGVYTKIKEKFSYLMFSNEKYLTLFPESQEDLIREGVKQKNCVATYLKRGVAGTSIVMFVRRRQYPSIPFVTAEIDVVNMVLCQVKGARNERIYDKEIIDFIKNWSVGKFNIAAELGFM